MWVDPASYLFLFFFLFLFLRSIIFSFFPKLCAHIVYIKTYAYNFVKIKIVHTSYSSNNCAYKLYV
jgi:hypothetical protein